MFTPHMISLAESLVLSVVMFLSDGVFQSWGLEEDEYIFYVCHETFSYHWPPMIIEFTILCFSQGGPFKSWKDIGALLLNMIKWELNLICLQYTEPLEVCSGNNNNQSKTKQIKK